MSSKTQGRCFLIAEAGVNHGGDEAQARRLVEAAAGAGACAVKFQSFDPEQLVTRSAPRAPYQGQRGGPDQRSLLEPLVLGAAATRRLARDCEALRIEFISSPFDIGSLHHLVGECGIRRIKLGSGELTHGALLLESARQRLPIILSTGMSRLDEVERALAVLAFGFTHPRGAPDAASLRAARRSDVGCDALGEFVTLLHCNSAYPTPPSDVNLRAIDTLRTVFGLRTGLSDHSVGSTAALAAVARGATMVEKHLTLDCNAEGPDHRASMEAAEFRDFVALLRGVERCLGSGIKKVTASEAPQRSVARRSLVCTRAVRAGERWTEDMLTAKRPGDGLSPMALWELLGRPATRAYAPEEAVALHEAVSASHTEAAA